MEIIKLQFPMKHVLEETLSIFGEVHHGGRDFFSVIGFKKMHRMISTCSIKFSRQVLFVDGDPRGQASFHDPPPTSNMPRDNLPTSWAPLSLT